MLYFIITLLFIAILFMCVSLLKTYNGLPAKELKRRAREGDQSAALLYRAVAHGAALDAVLWLIVGLSGAIVFFLITSHLAWWGAVPVMAAIIWLAFAWVPAGKVSVLGEKFARAVSPLIATFIVKIRPLAVRLAKWLARLKPIRVHTGIYEKEDLLELLDRQTNQIDNRISEEDLQIAKNALTYSEQTVADVMTPRGVVKKVSADETIGPVLMGELHDSGFSRFPVFQDMEDHLVGTLYLKDVVAVKDSQKVAAVMEKSVYYVQAHNPLNQVLDAFLKTKHHMFIVVDEFEEILGVVTIEDVLEAILGQQIVDEFDKYDDMRAVAAHRAKKLKISRQHVVEERVDPIVETVEEDQGEQTSS